MPASPFAAVLRAAAGALQTLPGVDEQRRGRCNPPCTYKLDKQLKNRASKQDSTVTAPKSSNPAGLMVNRNAKFRKRSTRCEGSGCPGTSRSHLLWSPRITPLRQGWERRCNGGVCWARLSPGVNQQWVIEQCCVD